MLLPRVALTLGDVAGIGPEVVAKAVADPRVRDWCRPVVVGHPEVLRKAVESCPSVVERPTVRAVNSLSDAWLADAGIPCWNPGDDSAAEVPLGANDARAGRAAYTSLTAATAAALRGELEAITTAPLSKAALHLAGLDYPGHTEILAEQCGVSDYAMMLYLPPGGAVQASAGLGVVHVTLHTSIRSVPDLLTVAGIREKIGLIDRFMLRVSGKRPRIGVCALNPHAGEEGLFGDEEARLIAPAVALAKAEADSNVTGPVPADTLIKRACGGEFDAVVAMYHDQGHIALKLIGFGRAVNVTLGLPIVRTSPSHGTAFDIAGRDMADPAGMIEAIRVAVALTRPT